MSRPSKCPKVSKVEDRENLDRISSLPDDVLGYMLSFLPTKGAVGTSILSSRWRYLYMLTNCLTFDASCRSRRMDSKARKKSFRKFVYRVLLLHKVSPIKKFSLDCGRHVYDDLDLHTWISAAIFKGVEQLHLFLNGAQFNALPRCLFSCQNIVKLILTAIKHFRVPESIYLPNLKILYLYGIKFDDRDSIGKLFSACSSLQELEVVSCKWPLDSNRHLCLSSRELKHLAINYCEDKFQVDAPNLAWLQYRTDHTDVALSLKNTNRLVTAILEFSFTEDSNSIQLARALFKTVRHVRELELLYAALEFLPQSVDDHIPSYPNLMNLHLGQTSYETWMYKMHWLANSPRLETLIFNQSLVDFVSREDEWPPNIALVPFSSRLKVIEASGFCGFKTELVLLKYLLGNAKVLERLTLYKDRYEFSKEQELEASNELLMLPRASRTCVVQLRDCKPWVR